MNPLGAFSVLPFLVSTVFLSGARILFRVTIAAIGVFRAEAAAFPGYQ